MSPHMQSKLRSSLVNHEGKKNYPYLDTKGNITIGIGYNLSSRGINDDWIDNTFNQDVAYFYATLSRDFYWFLHLNEDRQIILIDMCFMGYKRFLTFEKMLSALSLGDYKKAAQEMLNSRWAQQVPNRAKQLAIGMMSGIYDISES